jgi:hypothetical protein
VATLRKLGFNPATRKDFIFKETKMLVEKVEDENVKATAADEDLVYLSE